MLNARKNNLTILSGGQTGVDRAALDFALNNNMLCGGWCPLGRKAEDGTINSVYPLSETFSDNPKMRTEMNILGSDATLIIVFSDMDEGTQFTLDMAKFSNKPVFVWETENNCNYQQFKNWLIHNHVQVLNIAGPCESNAVGIYCKTIELLEDLIGEYHD